jgi:glutamine---fructose-6-phosphate transaminase (isomerizing)
MLDNIRNQPESLRAMAAYQFGAGAEALRSAAAAIRGAGRVVFTGMGSSLYASIPAAAYLNSNGFPALTVDTSELLHFGGAAPDTAVVLVSRSGETVEVTKLLARLGQRATVGVTNVPGSQLALEVRSTLHINSAADRMVAVQTYTATVAVLMLLAGAVLEIENLRGELGAGIDAASDSIDDALSSSGAWSEFFAGTEVVYLLGRGASMASVHEGALLFNEAARLPSVAMSAALFRHGPVEVVDSRFRAIIFASQEATRDLDLALARDLEAMGGCVRVCEGRGVFAPLSEIVPVQVAACSLAFHRGLDPGDFRHATQVTTAETGFGKP